MKNIPISELNLTGNTNLRPFNNNRSSRNRKIKDIVLDLRRKYFVSQGFSDSQISLIEQTTTDPPLDFQYLRPNNTLDIAIHTLAHFSLQPIEIITAEPKVLRLTSIPKTKKDANTPIENNPVDETLARHVRNFKRNVLFSRLSQLQEELQARMQRVIVDDPSVITNAEWHSNGNE